jgi:hypothetical protein
MTMGTRAVLPTRPLRLRAGHVWHMGIVAAVCFLLGAGALAGVPHFAHELADVARDREVWDHGVRAADGSLEGRQHSRIGLSWLLAWYELRVMYVDDRGERHDEKLGLNTAFGELNGEDDVEIRYDPAHPERFAVSWAVSSSGARYRGAILFILICAAIGACLIWAGWKVLRDLQRDKQTAAEGGELELRVVGRQLVLQRGGFSGEAHYALEVPPVDGISAPRAMTHKGPVLLESGTDGSHVIALAVAGDHRRVLLVHADLAPLVVTDAEREAAQARAGAAA